MSKCPCCGGDLPPGTVPREEIVGRLETTSRLFRKIVQRLAWRPGNLVPADELADYAYRDREDGGPLYGKYLIKEMVHRHGQSLHALGWRIENVYGWGYRLVALDAGQSAGR